MSRDDEEGRTDRDNLEERGTGTEGTHTSTAGLVELLLVQQRALGEQQLEATRQHERAMESQAAQQRLLEGLVQSQQEALVRQREEMSNMLRRGAELAKPKLPKPTLQKLDEKDDIENYLDTFERIAKQQEWPTTVWAVQLAGLLSGRALAAYAALGGVEAADYEKVKSAVLHRYEVNEETHRLRFRQEKKTPEESYCAWICRTTDHFDKWMKDQVLTVREVIIKEQLLRGMPEGMAVWLKERKPKSLDEFGQLADEYALARKNEVMKTAGPGTQLRSSGATSGSRTFQDRGKPSRQYPAQYPEPGRAQVSTSGEKRCYVCGRWGHLSYNCPNRKSSETRANGRDPKALFAEACDEVAWDEHSQKYLRRGTVDGKPVPMLIDTGSDRTMVAAHVVERAKVDPDHKVPVLCVHGDVCSYPTAEVHLVVGPWEKKTRVAVAPNLPVPVLLGRDIYQEDVDVTGEPATELAVMTRSRTRQLDTLGGVTEPAHGAEPVIGQESTESEPNNNHPSEERAEDMPDNSPSDEERENVPSEPCGDLPGDYVDTLASE